MADPTTAGWADITTAGLWGPPNPAVVMSAHPAVVGSPITKS